MDVLGKHTTAIILFAGLLVPTIGNAALVDRLAVSEGGLQKRIISDVK